MSPEVEGAGAVSEDATRGSGPAPVEAPVGGPEGTGARGPTGGNPVRADVAPAERTLDAPNEAVPQVAPLAATTPVGSIPAAEGRRAWSRLHALNWRLFLVRALSAGLAVVVTVALLPGLGFAQWGWGDFLRVALVFGLLNALVKPLLQFLVLRFIFSTYGVVVVLINAALLAALGRLMPDTFETYRPSALIVGGLVVGLLGLLFETLLGANPPVLDRDYKERNGLQ